MKCQQKYVHIVDGVKLWKISSARAVNELPNNALIAARPGARTVKLKGIR
jgi:hypothetical protein